MASSAASEKDCADGVSVHYLKNEFLDNVLDAGFSLESTIYEIEDLRGPPGLIRQRGLCVKCPLDGNMGAAFVHCLEGSHNVGPATHMLSYTWGYKIGDIIGTLVDFCKKENLDQEKTYFWICFLCVNQHRVVSQASVPTMDFVDTFGRRVSRTGRILCMMAPWQSPLYLRRIWCIYEIFLALTSDQCQVDVAIPPGEKLSLVRDLLLETEDTVNSPVEVLYEALNSIKVEDAEASNEPDRRLILNLLQSQTNGYHITNQRVKERLKGHLLGILLELGKQCRSFALLEYQENADSSEEVSEAPRISDGLGEVLQRHRNLQVILCCLALLPVGIAIAWLIQAIII